jgi:hypothetical protein
LSANDRQSVFDCVLNGMKSDYNDSALSADVTDVSHNPAAISSLLCDIDDSEDDQSDGRVDQRMMTQLNGYCIVLRKES